LEWCEKDMGVFTIIKAVGSIKFELMRFANQLNT
jgi:hypothetical protein